MLGQLTGEYKADGRLYLPGGHGLALVVLDQAAGLAGDPPEGVGDEGVEDGHGPLGDAGVRVYLLEDAVDVDVVGLSVLLPPGSGGTAWASWHVLLVFCRAWCDPSMTKNCITSYSNSHHNLFNLTLYHF